MQHGTKLKEITKWVNDVKLIHIHIVKQQFQGRLVNGASF